MARRLLSKRIVCANFIVKKKMYMLFLFITHSEVSGRVFLQLADLTEATAFVLKIIGKLVIW
jgi:hypothetical protein